MKKLFVGILLLSLSADAGQIFPLNPPPRHVCNAEKSKYSTIISYYNDTEQTFKEITTDVGLVNNCPKPVFPGTYCTFTKDSEGQEIGRVEFYEQKIDGRWNYYLGFYPTREHSHGETDYETYCRGF